MAQYATPIHSTRSGEYFLQQVKRYLYYDDSEVNFDIAKLPTKQEPAILHNFEESLLNTLPYLTINIRYKKGSALTSRNTCSHNWKAEDVQKVGDLIKWPIICDVSKAPSIMEMDSLVRAHFSKENNRETRHGYLKQDFVCILMDPRVTCNLSGESKFLDKSAIWERFLQSIFYVGVANSYHPYTHLREAADIYHSKAYEKNRHRKKLERILDIWRHDYGVVYLPVFHEAYPKEAYDRKEAIVEMLGLTQLTNSSRNALRGPAKRWVSVTRQLWATSLLHSAMNVYLRDGETLIFPKKRDEL